MPQLQVINRPPSAAQQILGGLGQGLGTGLGQGIQEGVGQFFEQKLKQERTNSLLKTLGIDSNSQPLQESMGTEQSPVAKQSGLGNLTPEKIFAVAAVDPQMGSTLANIYQSQQKSFEKQRSYESERSTKYLDKVSDLATNIPERRMAIDSAKSAVTSGQMTPFGGDFVADILNLPQLRTSSGAQLATAAKTNLVGSLSQITGGRPNQFIEQQINNAFAKAGQTKEANLAQLEIIGAKLDIDEKLAQITDQLADQYRQQLGYVPESIDRDVRKEIKPYADQRMKELAYDLRENSETELGSEELKKMKKVPNGTPLTLRMAKILIDKYGDKAEEVAVKLGYEIPGPEIYSRKK